MSVPNLVTVRHSTHNRTLETGAQRGRGSSQHAGSTHTHAHAQHAGSRSPSKLTRQLIQERRQPLGGARSRRGALGMQLGGVGAVLREQASAGKREDKTDGCANIKNMYVEKQYFRQTKGEC
jgi:hypothetical protein